MTVSRIGVGIATIIGFLSIWDVYEKTGSFLSGVFFGIVMGFVVFLIASSVVAYCIELCLHALSKVQVIFISIF